MLYLVIVYLMYDQQMLNWLVRHYRLSTTLLGKKTTSIVKRIKQCVIQIASDTKYDIIFSVVIDSPSS